MKKFRVPLHDGSGPLDLPPRCPVVPCPVGKPTLVCSRLLVDGIVRVEFETSLMKQRF